MPEDRIAALESRVKRLELCLSMFAAFVSGEALAVAKTPEELESMRHIWAAEMKAMTEAM